jgi:hypothetical protein
MSEKCRGAGSETVCPGLEKHNKISNTRVGQLDFVTEQIERSAQAADNRGRRVRRLIDPVAEGDGVIAADDLAEVAGSRELVVQTAVDHNISLPARVLAVHDPRDINTGLADKVAAELKTRANTR